MKRRLSQFVLAMTALGLASTGAVAGASGREAAITGTVSDTHGTPQMGALVEIIDVQSDSGVAATAFTDMHGRYSIPSIGPGKYELKATAALFLPALRDNLQLRSGGRVVVNLTLSTLFEAVQWLPARKRKADEPDDDWKWTLRSAANRPILRMLEDGPLVMVSTSNNEKARPSLRARIAVENGDGGFGDGGLHNAFTVDRVLVDGSGLILRADLGSPETSYPQLPSTDLTVGYQRKLNQFASVRSVVSYQSHPELVGAPYQPGLQALTMQSAEQVSISDALALEFGSELTAVRTTETAAALRPFVRATLHPSSSLLLAYSLATARDMQGWDDMDAVQPELPVAVVRRRANGHAATEMEQGVHQEISAGWKTGRGLLQVAYYHDNVGSAALAGGGTLDATQLAAGGVLADPTTETFRMLGPGYQTNGLRLSATEPLTSTLWAVVEFSNGEALTSPGASSATGQQGQAALQRAAASLRPDSAESVTVAIRGTVIHSKTQVRAAYRWQPEDTLTAVDAFNAFSDQPYFSFYLRQPIHLGHVVPNGFEALVDVTNLLAQGYRPVLSSDGQTLFFAQGPRTVQGGLSFTF